MAIALYSIPNIISPLFVASLVEKINIHNSMIMYTFLMIIGMGI